MDLKKLFILIFFGFCYAGITNVDIDLSPATVIGWRFAALTPQDTPFGDTFPALNFNYYITSIANSSITNEAVLFHSSRRSSFGKSYQWCCTDQLYKAGDCISKNRIIFDYNSLQLVNLHPGVDQYFTNNNSDVFYWPSTTTNENGPFLMDESIQLQISGVWYFVIADCQQSNNSISVEGTVDFTNPFGYLSADLFPNIPVYISLASAYFGISVVWIIFLCIYRKNIIGLQKIITVTLLSGLLEGILWSSAWAQYNNVGFVSEPLNLVGALLATIKLTFIRTLVLLVSIGYSIIFPTLQLCPKLGVIILSFLYACVVAVSQYVVVLDQMGIDAPKTLRWSMFGVQAILNGVYAIWIAYSLYINIKSLKMLMSFDKIKAASALKLKMYTYLAIFLGTFVVLSIIAYGLELFFTLSTYQDRVWSINWIFTAYWEFAYLFLTLLITYLWRPNSDNFRFQCTEPFADLEENEPALHLQPPPPEYSQKEEPKSPLLMSNSSINKKEDDGSEMDELVL